MILHTGPCEGLFSRPPSKGQVTPFEKICYKTCDDDAYDFIDYPQQPNYTFSTIVSPGAYTKTASEVGISMK